MPSAIKVVRDVLSANDEIAARNQRALAKYGILTVNIMASPGAGKTSLIMETSACSRPGCAAASSRATWRLR